MTREFYSNSRDKVQNHALFENKTGFGVLSQNPFFFLFLYAINYDCRRVVLKNRVATHFNSGSSINYGAAQHKKEPGHS